MAQAASIPRSYRRAALGLLILFLALASLFSVVTPLWEAPDELGHFYYALELARDGNLPVQAARGPGEAHQPPGYYAVIALPMLLVDLRDTTGDFRFNRFLENAGMGGSDKNFSLHGSAETFPWRGYAAAFHLARLVSVFLAAGTVALTLRIGWHLFPKRPLLGLLGAAITALNPQFLFISGALNNDTLLALAATGAIWSGLRARERPERTRGWVITGLWLAIGALAKLSIVPIILWAGLLILWSAWRMRSARFGLKMGGIVGLLLAFALGWWMLRNQILYGDPLGYAEFSRIFAWAFRKLPFSASDIWPLIAYAFESFWGLFGWINVPAPGWFHGTMAVMTGLAAVGLFLALRRRPRIRESPAARWLGLAAFAQVTYFVANAVRMDYTWHQGRYLFPVIAPISLALAVGLLEFVAKQRQPLASLVGSGALATLALVMLFGVLRPAYAFGFSPKWSLWLAPGHTQADFGGTMGLRGYETRTEGDRVRVTLYWQAFTVPDFDYSSFVHLVDASGQVRAQADQGPGRNVGYTPIHWQPEDVVIDQREIEIPPGTWGSFNLSIGVYNYVTGKRLNVTDASGLSAGDSVMLPVRVNLP